MGKSKKVIGNGAYSFSLYKNAVKEGAKVVSARGDKVEIRRMHRDNLVSWIADGHFDEAKGVVTDPRSINPYRGKCYGAIVAALMTKLPSSVKTLKGEVSNSGTTIKSWDSVVEGAWVDQDELFNIAVSQDAKLRSTLKERQSERPGVKKANRVTDPRTKFGNNIKTIQRLTGVTPYGLPLSQACMAIDSRWSLKNGFFIEEFRLVVGRNTPEKEDGRTAQKSLMEKLNKAASRKSKARKAVKKAVVAEPQTAELATVG